MNANNKRFFLKVVFTFTICFYSIFYNAQTIKVRFTYQGVPVINTIIQSTSNFIRLTDLNGEILLQLPGEKREIYYTITGKSLSFGQSAWLLDSVRFNKDTLVEIKLDEQLDMKLEEWISKNWKMSNKAENNGLNHISFRDKAYTDLQEYFKTHNYLMESGREEEFMFYIPRNEQIQLKKDLEKDLPLHQVRLDSLKILQKRLSDEKDYGPNSSLVSRYVKYTGKLILKREIVIEKLDQFFEKEAAKNLPVKQDPVKQEPVKQEPEKKKPLKKGEIRENKTVVFYPPLIVDIEEEDEKETRLRPNLYDLAGEVRWMKEEIEKMEYNIKHPEKVEREQTLDFIQEDAQFPGGQDSLNLWLKHNMRFPEEAKSDGLERGKAYVSFVVETDGSISNADIIRGITDCPSCNEEAKRLVLSMPKWKAGKNGGKAVRSRSTLGVNFTLD